VRTAAVDLRRLPAPDGAVSLVMGVPAASGVGVHYVYFGTYKAADADAETRARVSALADEAGTYLCFERQRADAERLAGLLKLAPVDAASKLAPLGLTHTRG
jgi:hypothetical protein